MVIDLEGKVEWEFSLTKDTDFTGEEVDRDMETFFSWYFKYGPFPFPFPCR